MHKLRARTLMAESRARQDRSDLILQVTVAAREPVEVSATGIGRAVALHIVPRRPWWRTLGLHVHRMHRRVWAVSKGRAVRVEVQGLHGAYFLWLVVVYGLGCAVIYQVSK